MTDIPVSILYPKGMVSNVQEAQMTSQGNNVTAYEVATTFDVGATISALVVELILARVSDCTVNVSSDSIVIEVVSP